MKKLPSVLIEKMKIAGFDVTAFWQETGALFRKGNLRVGLTPQTEGVWTAKIGNGETVLSTDFDEGMTDTLVELVSGMSDQEKE